MKGIMSRLLWPWYLHSGRGDPWIQPLGRLSAAAGEDVVTECFHCTTRSSKSRPRH